MAKKDLAVPISKMQNMLKSMDDIDDDDMEAMMKSMSGDDLSKMNKVNKMISNKMWQLMAKTSEGSNNMDKIYTQEELDAKVAEKETAAAETLKAKDTEITTLKAQLADKDKVITEKDQTIVSVTDKVNEISAEMKDTKVNAALDKWWTENEKMYDPKDKTNILSARKAVLENKATTEQIDSLITARKVEVKPVDLLGNGFVKEGKDLDLLHGIRTREGFVRK